MAREGAFQEGLSNHVCTNRQNNIQKLFRQLWLRMVLPLRARQQRAEVGAAKTLRRSLRRLSTEPKQNQTMAKLPIMAGWATVYLRVSYAAAASVEETAYVDETSSPCIALIVPCVAARVFHPVILALECGSAKACQNAVCLSCERNWAFGRST